MNTRTLLILIIYLLSVSYIKAAKITVSNDPNSPAQYNDLQVAIYASSAGDTIYVHGSTLAYSVGAIYIDRQLTLIGPGANPDKQNPLAASMNALILSNSNASGSTVEGFKTDGEGIYSSSPGVHDIKISRNKFTNYGFAVIGSPISNCVVVNNIFYCRTGITINNTSNWLIENNIFYTYDFIFGGDVPSISYSNQGSVVINHNLFLGAGGVNASDVALSSISFAVVTNNIFFGRAPSDGTNNVSTCSFNNNISFGTYSNSIPNVYNIGSGNIINQDPLFNSAVPVFNGFSYGFDYHLQATSPGHNAATDGTDIGIYGGNYAFPDLTGSVNIPQVTQMNIINASVPVGGSLNVQIKAKSHK